MDKNKVFFKSKKSQNFTSTFSRILMTDARFSAKCFGRNVFGGGSHKGVDGQDNEEKKRITSDMQHNKEEQ